MDSVLCWTDKEPTKKWQPSAGNVDFWPKGPKYPDTQKLDPGDIILFSPIKPTVKQKAIRVYQKKGRGLKRGFPYTHAALYIGDDSIICEATPDLGVAFSQLEARLDQSCILVRRVPGLADPDRHRMVQAASQLLGNPYGFRQIFTMALEKFHKSSPSASQVERQGVICSTLCEHAIIEGSLGATQIRKFSYQVVTPADLMESEALIDVPLEWRRNHSEVVKDS